MTLKKKNLVNLIPFFITLNAFAQTNFEVCPRAGTCFSKLESYQGKKLALLGAARFKYFLFNVYSAGLYREDGAGKISNLDFTAPLKLEIRYYRTITAEDLVKSGDNFVIKQNIVPLATIKERLAKFNAVYQTVNEGDKYELYYLPGIGTKLILNNKELITVEGEDFARAYFSIWLDEKAPLDLKLKDSLFGNS